MHDAQNSLDLLDGFLVDLGVILDLDPQPRHAVGRRNDIAPAAQIFQRLAHQFFIGHCFFLLVRMGFIR